jgi:hypothetical protein
MQLKVTKTLLRVFPCLKDSGFNIGDTIRIDARKDQGQILLTNLNTK